MNSFSRRLDVQNTAPVFENGRRFAAYLNVVNSDQFPLDNDDCSPLIVMVVCTSGFSNATYAEGCIRNWKRSPFPREQIFLS